jgi:hypothetical protein
MKVCGCEVGFRASTLKFGGDHSHYFFIFYMYWFCYLLRKRGALDNEGDCVDKSNKRTIHVTLGQCFVVEGWIFNDRYSFIQATTVTALRNYNYCTKPGRNLHTISLIPGGSGIGKTLSGFEFTHIVKHVDDSNTRCNNVENNINFFLGPEEEGL